MSELSVAFLHCGCGLKHRYEYIPNGDHQNTDILHCGCKPPSCKDITEEEFLQDDTDDQEDDSIHSLPPVSPEDLVEGEWYVVRVHGEEFIGSYDKSSGWPRFRNMSFVIELKQVEAIYGPLRFKIGGAE